MLKFITFIAIYLPFQIALNPTKGIDLASIRVLILIAFFIWLAESLRKKKLIIYNNPLTWLVVAFVLINGLSLLEAKNVDWGARKLLFLLSIFPIYFVASSYQVKLENYLKFARALIASATAVALIGIVQFLLQFIWGMKKVYAVWAEYIIIPFLGKSFSEAVLENPSWLVNISGKTYLRATATFPDPHMLSFFLGLTIPLAMALFIISNKKITYGLAFGILLLCDALTFSRGGYLGIIIGLFFCLVIFWNKIKKKHKITMLIGTALLLLALIIPNPISARYRSIFDLSEGSNMGRIETWKKAGKVILDNPWLGVGIGNYPLAIKPSASYREPIYAHNSYLDIAAETGILNALIWIGILFSASVSFLKKSESSPIYLAGTVSLIIFSVHSLVELPIYSPVVLTALLMIISGSNMEKFYEKNI